jgi:hypothetical protein
VRLALLVLAALVASCATLPPCPARGGPAWTQWESAHFILLTDLDAADAQEAVRGLEQARAAVLAAAWRRAPEPAGRLTAVVFRSDAERRAFVSPRLLGAFVSHGPLRQSYIVKSGAARDDVIAHELAHAYARRYGLLDKAEWLDEGLARYLESLRLDDDGTLTYGQIDASLFRAVQRGRLTAFENLWQDPPPERRASFSATSWIAVHYLFNHEPERFADFQRRLIAGVPGRQAWREAFPDISDDQMDSRLGEYVFREGQFATFQLRLPPPPDDVVATPLVDAQVHALRALLFATAGDARTPDERASEGRKVRVEVAEALRLDPLEPSAIYLKRLWLREDTLDIEVPKKLIARRPTDPMGWLLLAVARKERGENEEAVEALEELSPLLGGSPTGDLELRVARPD